LPGVHHVRMRDQDPAIRRVVICVGFDQYPIQLCGANVAADLENVLILLRCRGTEEAIYAGALGHEVAAAGDIVDGWFPAAIVRFKRGLHATGTFLSTLVAARSMLGNFSDDTLDDSADGSVDNSIDDFSDSTFEPSADYDADSRCVENLSSSTLVRLADSLAAPVPVLRAAAPAAPRPVIPAVSTVMAGVPRPAAGPMWVRGPVRTSPHSETAAAAAPVARDGRGRFGARAVGSAGSRSGCACHPDSKCATSACSCHARGLQCHDGCRCGIKCVRGAASSSVAAGVEQPGNGAVTCSSSAAVTSSSGLTGNIQRSVEGDPFFYFPWWE